MSKFCTIPNKKDFENFSKGTNIDPLRMSNIYTIAVNKSNKDNNTNEIILPTVKEFLTVLNNIVNESPDKTLNVSNLKISELPPRFFQTLAPLNKAQYKRLLSEGRQDYINEYKSLYNKQTSFIGKIRDHIVNSVFKKSNNLMTSSKITEASVIMSNLIYETLLNRAAQLRTKYNDKSISVNDIIKGVFNKNTVEQVIQMIVSHELKNAKKRADANGEVFEENEYLKILQENPELITKGVLANLKTTYGIIIKTKKPVKTVDEVVVINNEQTDEINETEEEEEKSLVKTDTEENAADILGELYEQSSNAEILDKNEITVNNFNKDNISSIKSAVKQLRVILANLNILDLSNNTETDFRGTSKNMLGLNKKVDFNIAFNTLMSLFSGEQVIGDNLKNSPEIVESSDIIKFLIDQSVSYPWMLNLLDLYKSESKTAENLLNVLDNYLFVEKKPIKNFEKWYNSKNKVPYENVLKVIASESGLNALLFTNFYTQKNIYMIQFKNNQMKFINKANTSTKIFKQLVNKLSSGVLLITPKITSNTKANYNLGTAQNPKEFTEVLKNIQNEYDSINKEMLEQEITAKSFLDDEFLYNPKNKLLLNRLNNLFNMFGANLTQKDFTQLLYDKDKQHIPLIYKNISDIIYKDNERYANIKDLLLFTSTFTQNLKTLSKELIPIYSDYVEPSSRELGKSYYSHVLPDYTSTLLKRFRNKSSAAQELEYWAQDSMMYTDGVYNSHYLNLLKKGKLVLKHFPQLHYDKKPIEDFTNKDYLKSALNHFLNHLRLNSFKDTALYVNMITGDANSHIIFKAPRLPSHFIDSSTVTVQRALAETVFAEALRITALTAVSKNDKYSKNGLLRYVASYDINGEPIYKETPFSKNGKRFHTFAQLNTNKELNDAILNKKTGIMFMQNMDRNAKIKAIEDLLNGIVEENGNEIIVEENNVFQQEIDAVYNLLLKYDLIRESKNSENSQENTISSSEIPLLNGAEALVKSHIKNFVLNDIFAQSQFHLLISNDVAQNKNLPDIQKRDKQVVSPGQIYDKHIWKKLTGSFDINYVLVSDQMIKSNILNNIKNILDNNEKLTQEERDSIMSKYESIESTDGQSYITLEARKNKLKSLGVTMWTANHEKAYNNIVSGKFTKADLDLLGQETDKPQVYTKIMKKVGPYSFRVGMQVKTSEYLILPTTVKSENNPTYNSKETDISAYMEAHNIHVLAFNSAVKVGLFQNIGFTDFIKNVDKFKNDKIVDNTFKETNIVKVPIEDVKKQQEISDHITHSEQIIGSQLKKIIVTDIPAELNFNGKNIDANHFKILVKQFYEESVKKAYQKLEKRFANKEAILEFIQEQLLVSNKYSPELLELYTEIKNAEDVPLFDPQNSAIHEQLLLSAIKNDIINLKMKGGSLVQISASPSNDLRVEFNEDGKTIKHIEAVMPWAMRESIEFALDKDGYIDTSLVDEDVLKVIGYRIPSEHKYSIFPIKIVKFSDKSSGNNILLPHELMVMAGFDFDIDKLYVMLPEVVEDTTGTLKKVEYNNTELYNVKDLGRNSQKALNNLFFDLTWAAVTNKEATNEMFIPGGFDNWITASEILQVKEILGEDVSFEEIENMSKEQIEEILDNSDNRSIYSMETRLDFRKKNAAAAKLIGVMANQVPSHSITQMTDMVIKNPIKLFIEDQPIKHLGKKLAIVSEKSTKGKTVIGKIVQISRRIAQSVAASVDAVKQPILDIININMFTADVTSVLLRSVSEKGYGATDLQIGVFLNQPVIKTLSEEFENINQAVKKISKIKFINDVLKPYTRNKEDIAKINTLKNSALNFENLEKEFLDKDIDLLNLSETQLHVLIKFVQLSEVGQDLNNVSDLMKNDTSNSGLETSIFEGLQLQERIEKLKTQLKEDHEFFLQKREKGSDLSISFKNPFISFKEYVDLAVMESEDLPSYALVPYVNEAYEYGIKKPLELLEKFFPYNTDLYKGMLKDFSKLMYVNNTLKKKLIVDFTTFLATLNTSLLEDHFKNSDNYKEFVSNFPKVIAYMKTNDKIPQEIKNLPILSLLESVRIPGSNVNILQLQLDGAFTKEQKQVFTESWKTLHEITPEIAEGLVRYEILRNGLKFTPNSFGYLAPVKIINSIEGYYKDIQNILKLDYNSSLTKSFIEQFIANNIALIPSTKADMNNFKEGDYENYYLPTLETKPPKIVYLEEVISSSEIKRNYYKLEMETSTKEFYHYKKMNLLGIPNLFTEYNSNVELNNFEDFPSAFSEINTPKLNYENIGENGFQFFTTVLEDSTNNKEFFNELISETSEEVVENFKEIDTSLKININDLFSENTSILDNIKPKKTVDDNGQINC